MGIKFGPAGLGPAKDALKNLDEFYRLGLKTCEIAFTYGSYIKTQKEAEEIGKRAKELGISLSIHGQYWINLNSEDEEKIEKSKERILECLKIGTWLGAHRVIFHPGFYGKKGKEESYEKIKEGILELQRLREEKNYTPELAPETTGKVNVFGSVEEIARLVTDTGCSFCIDFAHILAREKEYKFEETFGAFSGFESVHIHFSGIVYGEKGEKNHKVTESEEWEKLIKNIPKNKEITIVNESPSPVEDSILGLKIWRKYIM